ncbi:hypothetical protein NDU88_006099 [Pleurodeles waltl]|uniref:Uncharacterized protein n=1 Tax=Pleurodeles waltl TaxID=8319 RepID=A0AAV7SNJ8_PLEWA|nr:hypothetical protein NDU88_006099 [Pleurodeles waltl]
MLGRKTAGKDWEVKQRKNVEKNRKSSKMERNQKREKVQGEKQAEKTKVADYPVSQGAWLEGENWNIIEEKSEKPDEESLEEPRRLTSEEQIRCWRISGMEALHPGQVDTDGEDVLTHQPNDGVPRWSDAIASYAPGGA